LEVAASIQHPRGLPTSGSWPTCRSARSPPTTIGQP